MEIVLDTNQVPGYAFTYKNVRRQLDRAYDGPFDGRNPFFNLHLDFPVHHGKYVLGFTPFFAAMEALRGPNRDHGLELMTIFAGKLNALNRFTERADELRRTIRLYFSPNKQLFKKRVGALIEHDFGPSLRPGDVDDALYSLLAKSFAPMIDTKVDQQWTERAMLKLEEMDENKTEAFNAFLAHLDETKFLANLRSDCIEMYAPMYDAEISLRPAIFLDLIQGPDGPLASGRVSSKDFRAYKDLYKDMCEVYSRQLNLVAGLNNLERRGDFNAFATNAQGAALSSLDHFANKTLSEKFKYLGDSWIPLNLSAVDPGIRNAIAHHITEYDEVDQVISYFPHKEGVRQERVETTTYLSFMRNLLALFRETHAIHQLIWLLGHHTYAWQSSVAAKSKADQ